MCICVRVVECRAGQQRAHGPGCWMGAPEFFDLMAALWHFHVVTIYNCMQEAAGSILRLSCSWGCLRLQLLVINELP